MANTTGADVGGVLSIWRYPVKSMMGEELQTAQVTSSGLFGDRVFALRDRADGKVATAKNPRKWPNLFAFGATLIERSASAQRPAVQIMLPDGRVITAEGNEVDLVLSKALNRDVTLVATAGAHLTMAVGQSVPHLPEPARAEEYWPDMDGLDHRETVTDFELPVGTFFDCATIHVLTTSTLDRLHEVYPQGRFEVPRFRPNIVVNTEADDRTFAENAWIGHVLAIGDDVRLSVNAPCGRCVMTTLAQRDLPADRGILRTAVQQNRANVGVYASVVHGGAVRHGDRVRLIAA